MLSAQGPGKLRTAELEAECLRLRREGLSHREIAVQLNIAPSIAYKRVRHALDGINRSNSESAARLRSMELTRLDELQSAIWARAAEGEVRAIDSVLRIMERRAKLMGLDAPTKNEHEIAADVNYVVEWGEPETNG